VKLKINFVEFIAIFVVFVLLLAYPICYWISAEEKIITVKDKERIVKNEDSYYLVFAEEGTFKNEDSFLFLKFNSSDVQGSLEEGKTYKIKVAGWRIPIMSSYENIIEICKD
jgi:hypothetical protein